VSASSYLKSAREDTFNPAKPPKSTDNAGDTAESDPDESNRTSRIITLSDEEQKAFEGSKPGEELSCEVRGNLEEDGHFHVMTVSPMGGASSYGEGKMADQVAQKVNPFMGMSQA
jgi:hypothetical protein